MTIGEKIAQLRIAEDISQEQLAEKISVSRQSVSKWEMDQAVPQIDKVLQLCELFNISTDELLQDKISLRREVGGLPVKNKYFGTDGFRGEANVNLTSMQAYKVGRFLGWYYSSSLSGCNKSGYRPRIVIGKDTRRSSYMLEYSIVAGITASGADAYMLHVTTTPSVSYVTRQDEFDCGIMITASHNPYYDNGIKIINKDVVLSYDEYSKKVCTLDKIPEEEVDQELTKEQIINITDVLECPQYEEMKVNSLKTHTRAFIKVQDGCDRFCSYCLIPYARGRVRSREPEKVIDEIKKIAETGIKEVIITGIHVASYGKDFKNDYKLIDLLEEMNKIDAEEVIMPCLISESVSSSKQTVLHCIKIAVASAASGLSTYTGKCSCSLIIPFCLISRIA